MSFRHTLFAALAGAFILCASHASATPTLANSSFGSNTLVVDSVTGLRWLNIGLTRGQSYNDVSAQLGAGGTFQGYRYASAAEAFTLFQDFGVIGSEVNGGSFSNLAGSVSSMLSVLGQGDSVNQTAETYALVSDVPSAGNHQYVYYATVGNGAAGFVLDDPTSFISNTATQVNVWGPVTSLLVQDVPEPVSMSLLTHLIHRVMTMGLRSGIATLQQRDPLCWFDRVSVHIWQA